MFAPILGHRAGSHSRGLIAPCTRGDAPMKVSTGPVLPTYHTPVGDSVLISEEIVSWLLPALTWGENRSRHRCACGHCTRWLRAKRQTRRG